MYRLIIADDEEAIRKGIANSIPWQEWGFEVTAVLSNGEEVVEEIRRKKPHVVLSDIRMPKMDGVELMQYLNKNYPEIKIVILSGYNDFEYLNMSIKSQVTEYLLKPTDVDEFEELFRKMKKRLDQEQEQKKEYEILKKNQMETHLNNLIRGYGFTEEELEAEFLSEDVSEYSLVILEPDWKIEDKEEHYKIQLQIVALGEKALTTEEMETTCFRNYEEYVVGIIRGKGAGLSREMILKCMENLQELARENLGGSVSMGISSFARDFRMLPQCLEQAKCCIRQKQFTEKECCLVFYEDLKEEEFRYYTVFFNTESLMAFILNGNEEAISEELHRVVSKFRERQMKAYWYVDRICQELLFHISRGLLRYDLRLEELMAEQGKQYPDLFACTSLEEKERFLREILLAVSRRLIETQAENKKKNNLAYTIRELVDREYCSNLMSLEYVSEKVKKNAAYISRIFKNEFECNFSEYVTRKRLERSKELLADPVKKVYEIAEQIGWADVSNYIKVFKRCYGISPNEYRGRLGRREREE